MKDIFCFINNEDVEKKLKELMYCEMPMKVIIENFFINENRLPNLGIYYNFFDYMTNNGFSFDGNVIEVGAGYFPTFSRYVEQYQNENKLNGTILAYDPKLIETVPSRIEYHKEEFTEETDVSGCSILVGIYPCNCTMTIVRSALKNNIPLLFAGTFISSTVFSPFITSSSSSVYFISGVICDLSKNSRVNV